MHKKITVFFLILLASCTTLTQQDQRKWESISCGGFKTWDSCQLKATTSCPNGFDVRNSRENQISQARTMDYSCKK